MQLLDVQLILSASDLNSFLACPHLTTLDLALVRGDLKASPKRGVDAELLARTGDEFEERYLDGLKGEGREVVETVLVAMSTFCFGSIAPLTWAIQLRVTDTKEQAQIAFFSMATPSGEEVPRNVEFLFSRNRLKRRGIPRTLPRGSRLQPAPARHPRDPDRADAARQCLCRFAEVGD